ncbi:MAG: 2,3-bisphosphoglycerate-independent phosphoglycerate mutase [Candidatus Pacebacteria bacterium]|nr:2,3-bisphosphoglycerate-independent phosphoglycerate mutase [Candidatus Paceibacterota bacterium]NUQ57020.1 2,3-bisphosphoglycerate-independent phosphoglycerate mutase [Candidatus Paceibacter sp.]
MNHKKVILLILDGWGLSDDKKYNAIAQAKTPNFNYLWNNFPHCELEASGKAVGLPEGQMGNSEVGHMNIGAGRVVYQDLEKINKAVEEKILEKNPLLAAAFEKAKKFNSTVHIKGLVSPGGVHSHIRHLYALIDLAKKSGVPRVFIHAFTDGRDTPPQSAEKYVAELESVCKESGMACVASLSGRYYAMDRDNNWDRTQCAFNAITKGEGEKYDSPAEAIRKNYESGVTDEFIKPCVFPTPAGRTCEIMDHDVMIFFNFRSDRARQLAQKFNEECHAEDFTYLTMTEYDSSMAKTALFSGGVIEENLAEVLSKNNLKQFHVAETEKFAHATYFFNGGREYPYAGEDRLLIPSNKVATHDLAPEMKAEEIADAVVEKSAGGKYDFILANFANLDMVGHSGKVEATVRAVEAVDGSIGRIFEAVKKFGYVLIVTADHGNAEKMFDDKTGSPHTAHTESRVPLIIAAKNIKLKNSDKPSVSAGKPSSRTGKLADIAPTILEIMGIEKPAEMRGESLALK